MKKLTLITLTLVLMLGSTLNAAKKPNFTTEEIQQVKQLATLFKTKNYGNMYYKLSILNYYKIKDPIKMAKTWLTNWQNDPKKTAQRLLFADGFYPKDWDSIFYADTGNYELVWEGIKKKLTKYKYKKLKGFDALDAEFNNLINGGTK